MTRQSVLLSKQARTKGAAMYDEAPLFVSGQQGYHTFRIPALAVTNEGTLLAFCEGRVHDSHDSGEIRLIVRRSFDGGRTWGPLQVVADAGRDTAGNPAPVVDQSTGVVWLPFTQNLAEGPEALIVEGKAPRTVWLTHSDDDGGTWADPIEITQDVKLPTWTWYATGPGHGIQLASGRMVVACDHVQGTNEEYLSSGFHALPGFHATKGHSHLIYSDDHGASWYIGGIAQAGTNESCVVEAVDGSLYLNCRNYSVEHEHQRAFAWSRDQGATLGEFGWDSSLPEPICQASLARLSTASEHGRNRVLFSNPASDARENMTVRLSYDECATWGQGKALYRGLSAYSDLCVLPGMTICCLYERGTAGLYETLTLARFDLDWLTDGEDSL
jgi:sialidase-1